MSMFGISFIGLFTHALIIGIVEFTCRAKDLLSYEEDHVTLNVLRL